MTEQYPSQYRLGSIIQFAHRRVPQFGDYEGVDSGIQTPVRKHNNMHVILPKEPSAYILRVPAGIVSRVAGPFARRLRIPPTERGSVDFYLQPRHYTNFPQSPDEPLPISGPQFDITHRAESGDVQSTHCIWHDPERNKYVADILRSEYGDTHVEHHSMTNETLTAIDGLLLAIPILRKDMRSA